ncbi:hypothetical protein O181_084868 [Austropuccinia psidii MF-1]|uniref:Reverse transcriptase/retrotransposon-derived protein RNase H-like domain-containing protein n=1 Tax=Austropuccinia psidii MF-1 TaxID=1389203 RepID=A0A9Q3IL22_9BASI|nr:hypothetical protein [Austropuccinia psidii MF-1]
MDFIRKIGHNEKVELTNPVLITGNDGQSRLCGDFRALNNYIKAGRYPIPRIHHALDKLPKAIYISKIDCLKGFHQNGGKSNSMKLLRIICHIDIYEYTRMPFGIKNAPTHFQRIMDTIFQGEILEGWMLLYIDDIIICSEPCYYRNHIKHFSHIASSLYKLCSKDVVFEITKERRDAYERRKHELTNAPVLILPDFELPFKFYIDAACSPGLGAALDQRQVVDGEPREGVIFYISRKLKDSKARYGEPQTEFVYLV